MPHTFQAQLTSKGPGGGWTHVAIPFNVAEAFGSRGRTPVVGSIAAGTGTCAKFRSSLFPEGDGTHYLNVTKSVMAAAGVKPGDTVQVILDLDHAERTVEVPPALQQALDRAPKASSAFQSLAYSHRKEYVDWIASAKRPETISARIAKAVERLQSANIRRS